MKKYILLGGLTLATGGLGYLGYRWYISQQRKKKRPGPDSSTSPILPLPPTQSAVLPPAAPRVRPTKSRHVPDTIFPLKFNSIGSRVALLQKYLNHKYGTKLKVDGEWGILTDQAMAANGQPKQLSEAAFNVIQFAMKRMGLAGMESTTARIL